MSDSQHAVSYRLLFDDAARVVFFIATFLGRIPSAMRALGCVLLVQQVIGSFGLAGVVGATQTLSSAFMSPRIGRLIDRYGERRVLVWTMTIHTIGTIWLITSVYAGAPDPVILLGAFLIGASAVQFGSISRARWVDELDRGPRLEKAYALESMVDEAGFIVGPMLVVPLSVSVNAAAGLVASLGMTLIGSVMLITSREQSCRSTTFADTPDLTASRSVIRIPGVAVIALSVGFMGIIFGAVELVLVAFAEHLGHTNAASIMAAIFALGSLLGAVIYGRIRWKAPLHQRVVIAFCWIALGSVPMLLSNTIMQMSISVFVTGLAISPGMIASSTVIERIAPPRRLTEAFSWIGSSIATGAAVGSIIAGFVLDDIGLRAGQAIGLGGGMLCAVVIITWRRYLRQDASRSPA